MIAAPLNWFGRLLESGNGKEKRDLGAYQQSLEHDFGNDELCTNVLELRIHVVKSVGRPMLVDAATITRSGLSTTNGFHDRAAMLGRRNKKDGKPHITHSLFSQRNYAHLSLPHVVMDGQELVFIDPTGKYRKTARIVYGYLLPHCGATTTVQMHDNELDVVVASDKHPMTEWIRGFLRAHSCPYNPDEIDVLLQPEEYIRQVKPHHRGGQEGRTVYADGGQVLLASTGTLHWMNALRQKAGLRVISMDAFRPNIVIGLQPNLEDHIRTLTFDRWDGKVSIHAGLLGVRCKMIDIDPLLGMAPDKSVQEWLEKHRPQRPDESKDAKTSTFGLNMTFPTSAEGIVLRVGTPCHVSDLQS